MIRSGESSISILLDADLDGALAYLPGHRPRGVLRQGLGGRRTHAQDVIGQGRDAHVPGTTVNVRAVAADHDAGGERRRPDRAEQTAA